MHGLIHFFRLFLKINTRLSRMIKLATLIEEHQRDGLPRASTEQWQDNQDLRQSTLGRLRYKGTISYIPINGKYYYQESDIEKLKD